MLYFFVFVSGIEPKNAAVRNFWLPKFIGTIFVLLRVAPLPQTAIATSAADLLKI
jgi:hypothetical protein